MHSFRPLASLVVVVLATAACAADPETGPTGSTPPSATASAAASSPSSPSPGPAQTTGPTPTSPSPTGAGCDRDAVVATIDAAILAAGLAPVTAWSTDVTDNPFADRTASGQVYAERLGFDCGLRAAERVGRTDERLVVAAWTGPRMAWVVQTTESPPEQYRREATVDVVVDVVEGEFLDGDTRALWAGTLSAGETFVVGHVDFSLGAAAKDWFGVRATDDGADADFDLASERHAVEVLQAAGMRQVDIAQPPQPGSEEGYVSFVSPSGQISVADVGPLGWFDPTTPRYLTGPTRIETLAGAGVRVTEPGPDDGPGPVVGGELGFACDEFVWLLQPPLNGTTTDALASAAAILRTDICRGG